MKRRNLWTVLMCMFCLAVSCTASVAAEAEEMTEEQSEAAQTDGITAAELGEEPEEETELEVPERPDYEASGYVTLGDYKGFTLIAEPLEVTDEEVEEEIRQELQYSDLLETVEQGTVQDGDTVNIDYEGKKDGVAFDGGTDKGYDLVIGSHSFIDGFEEGLIGLESGATVDLPLTFPENYFNEELAGQPVVFTVTVNEIRRVPELSDEVAASVSDGEYSDAASYRSGVREKLEEYKEQDRQQQLRVDVLTQVANVCEINDYPQELMDYNLASMEAYYRSMAQVYSMDFEEFLSSVLNMTYEEFKEESVPACQQVAQEELYIKAIAEAEGIEISEEEYTAGTARLAEEYGYESAEDFVSMNDEKEIRLDILRDKVLDFLIKNAVVVDPEAETEGMTGDAATPAETETEAAAEQGEE